MKYHTLLVIFEKRQNLKLSSAQITGGAYNIRNLNRYSTFTNSEDPDEMPYNEAFHLGLHCLLMQT